MINTATINKLIEMRMTAMANALQTQLQDHSMQEFSFEERLGMLVDVEYVNRKNNRLRRLIRNASLTSLEPLLLTLITAQAESSTKA